VLPSHRVPVVAASVGCHWEGVHMPHPDCDHRQTKIAGVRKRAARRPPSAQMSLLRDFRLFVRGWIRRNMVKLAPDSNTSVEAWLAKTNYPEWRKAELLEKWNKINVQGFNSVEEKLFKVKCFIKDECYPEYKHSRGIYSRTDEFKCIMGPIFKLIEELVYENKHFIKHVPVKDRARLIVDSLFKEGATYLATDYTAFESLFTKALMESCEFELYRYMTSSIPEGGMFMQFCELVLAGRNVCDFREITVEVDATRMSGEMNTSLGNGFSNLMFMLFACHRAGSKCDGFVEGDDGIFSVVGVVPSSQWFENLGLRIKLEEHKDLSSASFCGIVADIHDQVNVSDPLKIVAQFGWVSSIYARSSDRKLMALLRCKSLSLLDQYPGCPIVQALAEYGLRMTRSFDVRHLVLNSRMFTSYERDKYLRILSVGETAIRAGRRVVPLATRDLMSRKFNVSSDVQILVEKYFEGLNRICPLNPPVLDTLVHPSWRHYNERFVCLADVRSPYLEYPPEHFPNYAGFIQEW